MSSAVVETKKESQVVEGNGVDGVASKGQPTPESQNSLVDHLLWPEFLAELQANRLADKAAAELEWAEAAPVE